MLRAAARKIRQERQAHKAPHGKQTVRQLMGHGEATSSIPVEAPALFDRAARRWNVDYAFYQTEPGKYLLFFKSKQADAITACMSDYSRRVLKQSRSRRVPILERLHRAQDRVRRQPVRERTKEVAHEDR
nr:PcfB family protein [uncultured Dysosmobacter sp.]